MRWRSYSAGRNASKVPLDLAGIVRVGNFGAIGERGPGEASGEAAADRKPGLAGLEIGDLEREVVLGCVVVDREVAGQQPQLAAGEHGGAALLHGRERQVEHVLDRAGAAFGGRPEPDADDGAGGGPPGLSAGVLGQHGPDALRAVERGGDACRRRLGLRPAGSAERRRAGGRTVSWRFPFGPAKGSGAGPCGSTPAVRRGCVPMCGDAFAA